MTKLAIRDFRGTLVSPEDPAYDDARSLWNGAIDRRPALIARCADAQDAATALAHAIGTGRPVAVRGGGHNVSGSALVDDGVVIDLSRLRGVEVDADRRLARVQPGARWADVDAVTQAHGLAVPAGIVSQTGVAGLTLGGGFGWLSRRWGLTSDNVVELRMLLADGTRVRATQQEESELFWAACGGGGNVGVVTEFTFRLSDLGKEVLAGPLVYRVDQAREVLHAYREFIATLPDQTSVYVSLRTAPAADWIPSALHGTDVLMLIPCHSGDLDAGVTILEPLRRATVPVADLVRPTPYLAIQSMFDAGVPQGWSYYWRSHYLPPLTDGAIDAIARLAWQKSSTTSFSMLFHLGGAIAARPDDASAASGRSATHALNINASWPQRGPTNPDIGWCREYFDAMTPHATGGVYVNFLHSDEGEARVQAAYGARFERLARAKSTFDPRNVFRSNQNIPPASTRDDRPRQPRVAIRPDSP